MKKMKVKGVVNFIKENYLIDTIECALAVASFLHQGVRDKGGVPYIFHPLWIANALKENGEDIETIIVAILHDTFEDTEITLEELRELFSNRIVDAVEALSKGEGEDPMDYIARVAKNDIARKVKRFDLKHNTDITRLKNRTNLTEKDFERMKIYGRQYDYLVGGRIGI